MRRTSSALLATLLLALATPLLAQRTTGAISGVAKDASGAILPGVTVSVTGENIVGSQTATTNEQGYYRFLNLPPGEYVLKFALSGFRTLTLSGIRVGVGQTVEGDASLQVSQMEEAVDVVAESPVVDTSSNEVGANYDRSWVENAPLRRYSFFDLVKSSPGTLDGGDGSRRSMVYGSGYDENSFQLDGVDITENFFNESSAEPNVDAIDEVEVLSLGAPAEYGNLTGAVFNIVTRQGTNKLHGDVNFFFQNDGLTSNNTENLKNPDGSFVDSCGDNRCPFFRDKFNDFTAQLGGPVIKDKLWFFASFQAQRDYYSLVSVDHSDPLSLVRDRANRYMGKITWQISPNHKLVTNFHLDKKDTDNGLAANSAPSTAWTRHSKTPTPGVAYTGTLSPKTVLDVRFSGFYGDVSGGPTDPSQPRDLTRFYNLDTGFISGGHYYWYETKPRRSTATAKVSHLADNFLGASHDFKFGVQYSDAVAKGIYGYNNLVFTYTSNGTQYGYGYERQPFSYSGNSRNLGVFVDDNVRVNNRLTFNLGLRYDHDKAYSAAQDEVDQFGKATGVTFPETDLYTWKNWSPRLGFNLRLTKDGKTVLKGHWGRYYRAIATGEFANVIGPSIKPTFSGTYDFATGTFPDATFFEGNTNLGVDPNYKSPHTDQYIVSLEREIVKGLGVQANYVYKRGRDYAAWRDITGQYTTVPFTDDLAPKAGNTYPGDVTPTGRTFDIYSLVSDPAERQFRITNPDGVQSDVHAFTVDVLKRMTGKWQLNASMNYLKATGRVQESKSTVGIQQRSGLQFRDFGKNINDFVNTDGRLRLDVTWNFKVQAVYQFPAGFLASANLTYRDNAWIVRRANIPASVTNIPEGTVILLQPRGQNDRLPRVTFLDMRLQKDFKFSKEARLSVFADALNLTNSDAYEGVLSATVTSSSFLFPASVINPRRIMLGAKVRF
jgi:outer membrane receptor protein involved in Fe transport